MNDGAERLTSKFYNSGAWTTQEGVTEDARKFEDLRPVAAEYVSRCRLRVCRHIPQSGRYMLDMASGPIQYPEYLEYSNGFAKRYCVDLSTDALVQAREKLGERGEYLSGSFFDLDLPENYFDCSISLHTIYHMEKKRQVEAVRKLLRVTKVGAPVIVVYSNPRALLAFLKIPFRAMRRSKALGLYFYAHPLRWWDQFSDVADVQIFPWRTFSSPDQKLLIPNLDLGRRMLGRLFALEDRYPDFFCRWGQYPMIVLTKR